MLTHSGRATTEPARGRRPQRCLGDVLIADEGAVVDLRR